MDDSMDVDQPELIEEGESEHEVDGCSEENKVYFTQRITLSEYHRQADGFTQQELRALRSSEAFQKWHQTCKRWDQVPASCMRFGFPRVSQSYFLESSLFLGPNFSWQSLERTKIKSKTTLHTSWKTDFSHPPLPSPKKTNKRGDLFVCKATPKLAQVLSGRLPEQWEKHCTFTCSNWRPWNNCKILACYKPHWGKANFSKNSSSLLCLLVLSSVKECLAREELWTKKTHRHCSACSYEQLYAYSCCVEYHL